MPMDLCAAHADYVDLQSVPPEVPQIEAVQQQPATNAPAPVDLPGPAPALTEDAPTPEPPALSPSPKEDDNGTATITELSPPAIVTDAQSAPPEELVKKLKDKILPKIRAQISQLAKNGDPNAEAVQHLKEQLQVCPGLASVTGSECYLGRGLMFCYLMNAIHRFWGACGWYGLVGQQTMCALLPALCLPMSLCPGSA